AICLRQQQNQLVRGLDNHADDEDRHSDRHPDQQAGGDITLEAGLFHGFTSRLARMHLPAFPLTPQHTSSAAFSHSPSNTPHPTLSRWERVITPAIKQVSLPA